MTGDTRHPQDKSVYLNNVASTVKRIRNHPALAYYVASNESSEVSGTPELLKLLDGTRAIRCNRNVQVYMMEVHINR